MSGERIRSYPKPEKKEKEGPISIAEFNRRYGSKKFKNLDKKPSKRGKSKSGYTLKVELLDEWFSRLVRLKACGVIPELPRHANCVCCKKPMDVKTGDCGHYFSRRHKSTRWEFDNCRFQCKKCNKDMGMPEVNQRFKDALINDGVDLEKLERKKNNLCKPTAPILDLMIEETREEVNRLLEVKGIQKWW